MPYRAWTMSPEQSQYIWRKTIPHIEVGMGSGVFTSIFKEMPENLTIKVKKPA